MTSYPKLRSVVLDCLDVHVMAEFYRALTGWDYPAGYDPADFDDWLSIIGPEGIRISFQKVDELPRTTWPTAEVPQQAHLDFMAASGAELDELHERVVGLGAQVRLDRREDTEEPLRVYADPAGHLFCLFTHNA
jgi:hypothetical protein